MKITGSTFHLNPSGVQEIPQDSPGSRRTFIFCDCVHPTMDENALEKNRSQVMIAMTEKSMRFYLETLHKGAWDQQALVDAIEYAHQKLRVGRDQSNFPLAVSACVFLTSESPNDNKDHKVYYAIAGDIRCYRIQNESLLPLIALKDPVPDYPSTQERFKQLENALGREGKLRIESGQIDLPSTKNQNFLFASYGLYSQSNDIELAAITKDPWHHKTGATKFINSRAQKQHFLRLCSVSFHANFTEKELSQQKEKERYQAMSTTPDTPQPSRQNFLILGLSVATGVIILLMTTHLTFHSSTTAQQQKETIGQDQAIEENHQEVTMLKEQIQEEEAYNQALESELEAMKTQTQIQETSSAQEQRDHNETLIAELQKEKNELQIQMSEIINEMMNNKVQMEKTDEMLSAERANSQRLSNDLRNSSETLETQRLQLEEKSQALSSLQSELESQYKLITEKQHLMEDLEQSKTSLEAYVNELTFKLQETSKDLNATENILGKVLGDYKSQSTQLASSHKKVEQISKDKQEHASENETLQIQLSQLSEKQNNTSQLLAEKTEQLQALEKEQNEKIALFNSKIEALSQNFESVESEKSTLNKELEDIKKSNQHIQEKLQEFEKETLGLKVENKELKSKLVRSKETELAYEKEKKQRQEKEQQFLQLASSIQDQKQMFDQLLQQKNQLSYDYKEIRQAHLELLKQVAERNNQQRQEKNLVFNQQKEQPSARTYVVMRGDTLSGISQKVYGTTSRWQDIYEANKETVPDTNRLPIGAILMIP